MLKIQEIRELIKLIDESSIDEFTFEQNGSKVSMAKNNQPTVQAVNQSGATPAAVPPAPEPAPQPQAPANAENQAADPAGASVNAAASAADADLVAITSPMVGTFYESPSPDAEPYVKKGDPIQKDSVVCIVEAMKLMNEIEAEVNGEIVDILVENGQLVEYGQEMFTVKRK
ncbi:acetyl-CoA carboxylase biotin carboxyl carrier protein [Salisediminibacterium halotolerans]|uniref:Biotin carboxyl carrier protein of acetyl-CoA carboxylase n=1 Tax=Salisediminibacterium halotolerans TaxID=517425 RepID=A0A1H9PH34_9BACI|nr:acetyl-CoA carboxylase biotin carboxyl carrier protein [Salisediminibacterium haloalkalitolerans]SER47179.1 acetyl-CoA carboxylase biotin carboxyl carrier protein [Salisediminibacterium haloalkalitolerans]